MTAINVYKKANKLIEQKAIEIEYTNGEKFTFRVLGTSDIHTVTLTFISIGKGKQVFQKVWSCTCIASSMRGMLHDAECAHSIACNAWLVNNIKKIK